MAGTKDPQHVVPFGKAGAALYPVIPSGKVFTVSVVSVVNYSDAEAIATIYAIEDGDDQDPAVTDDAIAYRLKIPANDTAQIGRGEDWPAGTLFWAVASEDESLNGHISGILSGAS